MCYKVKKKSYIVLLDTNLCHHKAKCVMLESNKPFANYSKTQLKENDQTKYFLKFSNKDQTNLQLNLWP